MKSLRIFAASPSDAATERAKVETVATMLGPLAEKLSIVLDVTDWSRVLPDAGRPEKVILDQLQPSTWDVFIGILWHRFGTPPAGKDEKTQKEYLSGTEEEFRIAYRLWEHHRRPRIMMYRCTRDVPQSALDPEQYKRVKDFFNQFDAVQGEHPGLYQSFDTTESFEKLLYDNLLRLLITYGEEIRGEPLPVDVVNALTPRVPDNLPRRAPFFGRENDMEITLRALSAEDRTWGVLLDGIGGIGKTALAIEAAYRSREKGFFNAFIYVSAKRNILNPSGMREVFPVALTLDGFLNETSRVLGEAGITELPSVEKRRALLDTLRGSRALLVYDNLETLAKEEQEALADFLRELPQGCKAIITSRRRGGEGAVWLRLERLEWGAALAIIESEIGRDQQLANKMRRVGESRWKELYDETAGSPLALMHMLGLIRVRAALTFDDALKLLRDNSDLDLNKFIFQEARRELHPSDESTLRTLWFFNPSATFDQLLHVSKLSPRALQSSLDRLAMLSLVDVLLGEERYALHPLTRNFIQSELLTEPEQIEGIKKRVKSYESDVRAIRRLSDALGEAVKERSLPTTIQELNRLSWNYWWSWAPDGSAIFRDINTEIWNDCEHSPRRLLSEVSEYDLTKMATDPVYVERVRRLSAAFDAYMAEGAHTWAAEHASGVRAERPVAYFCAEFGVHHSLPLYSGGLGILAGDHLKSASDLGLPLVAIGLLYHHGYFRQRLRRDGWQEETYNEIDVDDLPLTLVRDAEGRPVYVELEIRGRQVSVRAWRVEVGRVTLYLLDAEVEGNDAVDRLITGHLYGGDRETRCVQEMVLGVGGVRLLRKLGVEPHVFHLNEGHTAFVTLELARGLTREGLDFAEAAARVKEQCIFTTHTPVAAGHDEFVAPLIEKCFGANYWRDLRLSREEFLDLGRVRAGEESELFGLTPLALRMCRAANGVSRIHGEVSRDLWRKMWPGREAEDVPITSITNGVHAPTWVSPLLASLYERHVGAEWAEVLRDAEAWARAVEGIPGEALWEVRRLMKQRLIAFVRERLFRARLTQGEPREYAAAAYQMFDPDALTVGFARRVVPYERWGLILSDPYRLRHLLGDPERPVQLILAGKAHPQDQAAKVILQQINLWKLDPEIMQRAVFLQDYDQEIARHLVQAADVWLNVPRRPLEASGTSGEKAALNGGLNLSILDGWWPEGYDGTNGWAVGDIDADGSVEEIDRRDAESLYRVLETEVVPTFYERDAKGLPPRWVSMMRRAIQTLAPAFNSDRMVRDYTARLYLGPPAADWSLYGSGYGR
jgi:starch phosphorylase